MIQIVWKNKVVIDSGKLNQSELMSNLVASLKYFTSRGVAIIYILIALTTFQIKIIMAIDIFIHYNCYCQLMPIFCKPSRNFVINSIEDSDKKEFEIRSARNDVSRTHGAYVHI